MGFSALMYEAMTRRHGRLNQSNSWQHFGRLVTEQISMEALGIRKLTRLIKRLLWLLPILLVAADTKANHVVIAQWNFNSNPPDPQTRTGAIIPSFGVGTATLVGGQTFEFFEGSENDPIAYDNSGW